jgi:hypothetical protein
MRACLASPYLANNCLGRAGIGFRAAAFGVRGPTLGPQCSIDDLQLRHAATRLGPKDTVPVLAVRVAPVRRLS